ncbi:MAG: hypothetical protein AB7O66_18435 [Limisphaerales bacterium]
MPSSQSDRAPLPTRASQVLLAVILVTSVSGYFMGLRQTDRSRARVSAGDSRMGAEGVLRGGVELERESAARPVGVRTIVEYSLLGDAGLKPNAGWRSSLATLRPGGPTAAVRGERDSVTPSSAAPGPATDAERLWAVRRRATRRAFDGAPPVVPHPIDATSSANCRVCHAEGLVVRDVVAPRMSHPEMGSCTQCHVPTDGGVPPVPRDWGLTLAGNSFVGGVSVGRGSRAWPEAPPTIPHSTWMRENCASCHGPTGLVGLRTSHPERMLCTQCHVPEGGFSPGPGDFAELSGSEPGAGLNSPR